MAFWLGLILGALLVLPLAWLYTRRIERRLQRLAQRTRAAERLAELGTLTGGLAHEIKNPLSTVNLNIQLLQEDLRDVHAAMPAESQTAERLSRMQRRFDGLAREVQRVRDILEDFLRFAGRVKLNLEPVDLNVLVGELADFFLPQAHAAKVNLRTVPAPAGSVTVQADGALLKQAILNLMLNALQAMAEAREGSPSAPSELIIRLEPRRTNGQSEVHLHVIDTGPGIEPEKLDRIFQPYFSSKKSGTGLGLPTARRLVEEHGGQINVHSERGKGSDFTIVLPVDRQPTM